MIPHNPFYIRVLPVAAPFCNRKKELSELTQHSLNKMNVVLFSPRRYGKTSLIKRVLHSVESKGMIPIYIDLMGVTSAEDIAARITAKVYQATHSKEIWFKKALKWLTSWRPVMRPDSEHGLTFTVEPASYQDGYTLLEETLKSIDKLSKDTRQGLCLALDEFQEICELNNSLKIESIMRTQIQEQNKAAYLFIGSRRRLLVDMFNEKRRPFYNSALSYPLKPLPKDELIEFVIHLFKSQKKECSVTVAGEIAEIAAGYAYYVQKLGYCIFEISGGRVTVADVREGLKILIEEEKVVFDMMISNLAPQQISLLETVAKEPTKTPFAVVYGKKHRLGSIGGIQGSIKRLIELDYVEKDNGVYKVVDPIFERWLKSL
jgi:hypothetical protein